MIKEIDNIIHNSSLIDIEYVENFYTKKEKKKVTYVCSTEFPKITYNIVDVFYRGEIPHPKFGNRYFGIYSMYDFGIGNIKHFIINADSVEDFDFYMIKDKFGKYRYSSYSHDFVTDKDGNFIDGGRLYYRTNRTNIINKFKIKRGKFYHAKD